MSPIVLTTGLFASLNLAFLMWANKQKEIRRLTLKSGEAQAEAIGMNGAEGDRHPAFIYTY